MGVGAAVLTEMKITDDRYPKFSSGYKIIASKATSHSQGGVALVWKEGHNSFEVEAATVVTANLLTFQLVTGYERFYVMGIYIPPNDTTGVDALRQAWEACPADCVPLVMGDLNINFEHPRDAREDDIADLLDEINLVDSSRRFRLRRCRMQSAKRRWTWRQKRLGRWHYSQPDYILARGGDIRYFRKVAIRSPLVHDSDHRAVVATFRARRTNRLTKYRRRRQRLPLRLPHGPHDELTHTFEALKLTCLEAEPTKRRGNDWISAETWRLISHRTMLRKTGKLCQIGARRMQRQIWAALRGDREARTARVGDLIEAELAGGSVEEAFRHLKGWYRAASETTTRPCPQTMA